MTVRCACQGGHLGSHSYRRGAKVGMRSEQPINAMLPANNQGPMATADSVKFQPSVKYSRCRPTRS